MGDKPYKPLPVRIPSDYAERLGVNHSFISQVNTGAKLMGWNNVMKLFRLGRGDSRLKGLKIWHLRPDFDPVLCNKRRRSGR